MIEFEVDSIRGGTHWYTQPNTFRIEDMVSSELDGTRVQSREEGLDECQLRHDERDN